jgi:hypothetical protein
LAKNYKHWIHHKDNNPVYQKQFRHCHGCIH